ncbi:MAG: hypothetical protein OI74_00285 [Gammaproteobacteria bacterium (ex Lamellibrachia satsuma)]|nr:MAG: hypothetical protein HPY30_13380 [Gammaproteobacteria bacterium (ex Lamellibrachia satsuma)]RRS36108.1 MAG: hypothetical protein OI74_00285 [Gammaproteobacteria bacterium (ex Lamellibrachia satsuma)]RRS37239.1 MAG: hypothetical protein NV67_02305 [Gammaproteobacteria bacterium (ex Lamellibrachia satsuma)]
MNKFFIESGTVLLLVVLLSKQLWIFGAIYFAIVIFLVKKEYFSYFDFDKKGIFRIVIFSLLGGAIGISGYFGDGWFILATLFFIAIGIILISPVSRHAKTKKNTINTSIRSHSIDK